MSVLTEEALRNLLRNADLDAMTEYRVDKGVIVTPSARAWLIDHKIDLIIGDRKVIKNPALPVDQSTAQPLSQPAKAHEQESVLPHFEKPQRYTSLGGGFYEEKPEYMTALHGMTLVNKDHPRIALRGRIDSLLAQITQVQLAFQRLHLSKGINALNEVARYVQNIMRCEVLNQPMEPMLLFGMSEQELKERSHTPKKYYGIAHFAACVEDGEAVVLLNLLRTAAREVEIIAYKAFKREDGTPEREDIVQAFNRLSSVFYVMMFEAKTGAYADETR